MSTGYEKITAIKNKLKTPMTVEDLARAMGCGTRTIFRHLIQVQNENCGLHKFKQNGNTYYQIKTEKEVAFDQNVVKQLEKIRNAMGTKSPADLKNRKLMDKIIGTFQTTNAEDFKPEAVNLDPNFILDYGPFSDNKTQETMVTKVLSAIRDGLKIRINYKHSSTNKEPQVIEVSPVKVVMRIDTLYLIAADAESEKDNSFKNYMFENITNIAVTNIPVPKLAFDAAIHYKYAFGKYTSLDQPQEVSLLVKEKWLQSQFEKSNFSPAAEIRYDKNKNMLVNLKIRITPDFKAWLMGVLPSVQIQKPESLKNEMKELLKKTLAEM